MSSMGSMLGNLRSCGGFIDVLVGDPDYEVSANGIRHSAAFRARAQTQTEQEIRDWLIETERECGEREKEIASLTAEAVRCNKVAKAVGVTPAQKATAVKRAKQALTRMAVLQKELARERPALEQARQTLARVSTVQKADTKRVIFEKMTQLAKGVEVDESKIAALQTAGADALEEHNNLGEFEHALDATLADMERTQNADMAALGEGFDLSDDKQVMAALDALEQEQEPMVTPAAPPVYAGSSCSSTSYLDFDQALRNAPAAPTSTPQVQARTRQPPVAQAFTTDGRVRTNVNNDDDLYSAFQ